MEEARSSGGSFVTPPGAEWGPHGESPCWAAVHSFTQLQAGPQQEIWAGFGSGPFIILSDDTAHDGDAV